MRTIPRFVTGAILSALMLAAFVSLADAKVKPKGLATVDWGVSSIALDLAGNPHVACEGPDHHLYHRWFDGRRWRKELVDGLSELGYSNSIAIDALGHIHIVYDFYRGLGGPKLAYAHFDGSIWQISEPGIAGAHALLRLDALGRPHVWFQGPSSYGYAVYDGVGWQVEDTGFGFSPYSDGFVLDADGNAHVSYSINYSGCFYATNKSGSWVATTLKVQAGGASTAIGLDNAGDPHVLIGDGSALDYYSFDGLAWTSETVVDFSLLGNVLVDTNIAMTMDAAGLPHFLAGATLTVGNRSGEFLFYGTNTGTGWTGLLVDKKGGGYPSIAIDNNGVVYGTSCTPMRNNKAKARWVRITPADLALTQ